ncbi:MAG TPA: hypothetical protein VFA82_07550 [Gaiellaceae bacterium]|nr:hypothetical protein [Gaiellaceae bacterium]
MRETIRALFSEPDSGSEGDPGPDVDPFGELEAVFGQAVASARAAAAESRARLAARGAELEERERLLAQRAEELEQERLDLVRQRSEIVAEYTRARELAADAGATSGQLTELQERERAFERERLTFEAIRQQAEARLAARELAISERDAQVSQREHQVSEREADFATEARRLDQRQSSLTAAEARLRQAQAELEARLAALEPPAFDERDADGPDDDVPAPPLASSYTTMA